MAEQSNDLDQLLDSALDDFQTFNLTSSVQRGGENEGGKQEDTSSPCKVQGLEMGLPDLKSKKKGKQKVSKDSKKKGKQKVSKDSHVEDLDKLRIQIWESVKGSEPVTGQKSGEDFLGNDPMMEDWAKQFELGEDQDLESIMETMIQQLLSKEILHEPMIEIAENYPRWLKDNKSKLGSEEYEKFSHQYQLIKELNQVYETDPGNFTKIFELMQKMQDCGHPPSDIVKELSTDFDFARLWSPS